MPEDQELEYRVRKYRRSTEERLDDPDRAKEVVRNYARTQADMNWLIQEAHLISDDLGKVPVTQRFRLGLMTRQLYGCRRKLPRGMWLEKMARIGATRIREEIDPETVTLVLARCWEMLVGEFPRSDIEKLKKLTLDYAGIEGENMTESSQTAEEKIAKNAKVAKAEGGSQKAQDRMTNGELRMANDRSQKSEGKSQKSKAKGRKGLSLAKRVKDPLATMQDEPTIIEHVARGYAAKYLRQAIAPFLPLERQAVIARLCRKMSFDEIARELTMTRADVLDILTRAKKRVAAYTTYFKNEWYWRDGQPAEAAQ